MDNMSRLGRSHLFRGVGYFILAPVLFILFRGVFTLMDQGPTAQTPRDPTLVNVAVFIVLSTILYLLYSGCRNFRDYLAVRRAQRLGLRSWRIAESSGGVFHTSEVGSSLAKVIGQLSDEELLAAAHHPDHSLAAKSHFDDALKKRGLSKSVVADWMPAPATLSIGTNIKVTEVSYRSLMLATTVFRGALILLAIAALVIPALFISILAPRSNPFPFLIYTAAVILLFFTCLLIGATATRNRSMRILLLRPFGQRTMTRALKKVVRNKLGNVAHVYTLSDRHYRPNPFLRLWDIVGLIARLVIYLLSPIRRPSICVANVLGKPTFSG